jgi:hypothetical protein
MIWQKLSVNKEDNGASTQNGAVGTAVARAYVTVCATMSIRRGTALS